MHYLILSTGEYSDYSPKYFVGEHEVKDHDFYEMGNTVGDVLNSWFKSLPERSGRGQKYEPDTDRDVYSYMLEEAWEKDMVKWLHSIGYAELPEKIPEINVSYSGIPHH
jgi:hypothetical protein